MILCLSPNPAVDRNLRLPRLQPGEVHRAQEVLLLPGGKGHNVARAVRTLGAEAHLVGLLAGASGRWIAERMPGEYVWFEGETRHCHLILSDEGVTVLNEPGPAVPAQAWEEFLARAGRLAAGAGAVVLAGSLPPGADPAGLIGMIAACRDRFFLDTHGPPLQAGLSAHPFAVKVNAREAEELTGSPDPRSLLALGPELAVVTHGAAGAVTVTATEGWRVESPPVEGVSPVGSGDAFLAGLAVGFVRRLSLADSLRLAAAAGAANTLEVGSGVLSAEAVRQLEAQVRLAAV